LFLAFYFREKIVALLLSTFATQSALNGPDGEGTARLLSRLMPPRLWRGGGTDFDPSLSSVVNFSVMHNAALTRQCGRLQTSAGGAHDTPRFHCVSWEYGGRLAARRSRAASGDAGGRISSRRGRWERDGSEPIFRRRGVRLGFGIAPLLEM